MFAASMVFPPSPPRAFHGSHLPQSGSLSVPTATPPHPMVTPSIAATSSPAPGHTRPPTVAASSPCSCRAPSPAVIFGATREVKQQCLAGQHGGMIVTQADLCAHVASLEKKLSSFLAEQFHAVDARLASLYRQVEDQAMILHSIRDDACASKLDFGCKLEVLESMISRQIQEISVDMEEKLGQAYGASVPATGEFEQRVPGDLRYRVEPSSEQSNVLKKLIDQAATQRVRTASAYLTKGVDRAVVAKCCQVNQNSLADFSRGFHIGIEGWAKRKLKTAALMERMGMQVAGSLVKAFSIWHRVAEEGKQAHMLLQPRKGDSVDSETFTQQLETQWGHLRDAMSRMDEKCSELDEAVQRVRGDMRGEAEQHEDSNAELRQAVSILRRGQSGVVMQQGHVREHFGTVVIGQRGELPVRPS